MRSLLRSTGGWLIATAIALMLASCGANSNEAPRSPSSAHGTVQRCFQKAGVDFANKRSDIGFYFRALSREDANTQVPTLTGTPSSSLRSGAVCRALDNQTLGSCGRRTGLTTAVSTLRSFSRERRAGHTSHI